MNPKAGAALEELVREYFFRQGFFVIRGASLRFEGEEITDIDAWLYGKQSAAVRVRIIVDVKDKRSPKAFERILWARGTQLALGCDRAIVATTDSNHKTIRFAHQQRVSLLSKAILQKLEQRLGQAARLTLEEFEEFIRANPNQKQDGDWIRRIAETKSALVSIQGYPAFNTAMTAFRFFAEKIETRPQHKEQAVRCSYLCAAFACIALDSALSQIVYETPHERQRQIQFGVTYGDNGDGKTRSNIDLVLDVISNGVPNGRVVASQVDSALKGLFESVRADIISEFFSKEQNSSMLFSAARELEDRAYERNVGLIQELSTEAKSILGVFADFSCVKRPPLYSGLSVGGEGEPMAIPLGNSVIDQGGRTEQGASQSNADGDHRRTSPGDQPKLI